MVEDKEIGSEEEMTTSYDAVETAIRLAKGYKDLSWEEILSRHPGRISRWKQKRLGPVGVKPRAKPLSLHPLSLQEVLAALLATKSESKQQAEDEI